MQFFVRTMKNRFPDIPWKLISTWTSVWALPHDYGALEGVEVIQSTVLGSVNAGNVPMEETVMALLTLYNIDIGIKTEN